MVSQSEANMYGIRRFTYDTKLSIVAPRANGNKLNKNFQFCIVHNGTQVKSTVSTTSLRDLIFVVP